MYGKKKKNVHSNKKILNSSELIKLPELPQEIDKLISSFLDGLDLAVYSLVCKRFNNIADNRLHENQSASASYCEKAKTEKFDMAMRSLDAAYKLTSAPLQTKEIINEALERIESYIHYANSKDSHMSYMIKISEPNTNEKDKIDIDNKVVIKNELIIAWKAKWKNRKELFTDFQLKNNGNQHNKSGCTIA